MNEGDAQDAYVETGTLGWAKEKAACTDGSGRKPSRQCRVRVPCTVAPEPLVAIGAEFSPSEHSAPLHCT